MPWDENAFRARILARADARGMNARDVMRKAGIAGDTFSKVPTSRGRNYNTIEAIAGAVGISVSEAIGESGGLSMQLLKTAVAVAVRAVPSERAELLPPAIACAYDVLADLRRDGLPIDEQALSVIEMTLRARNKMSAHGFEGLRKD